MANRKCQAKTKKGKDCQAPPIDDTDFCISHSPKATQAKVGFGGSENGRKGGEAKRVPRLMEVLAEKVEAELDDWLAPLVRAREAERAVVVGNGPTAHVEYHPDIPTQLKATQEVFDRLVGRPKQTQEVTGAGGTPLVPPQLPTDDDWHNKLREAAGELAGAAPSTNGHGRNGSSG